MFLLASAALARDSALLCAAEYPLEADKTREEVLQKGWFRIMDPLDAGAATPTLDVLVRYDAVLVYPNADFGGSDSGSATCSPPTSRPGEGWSSGTARSPTSRASAARSSRTCRSSPGPREPGGEGLVPVIRGPPDPRRDHPVRRRSRSPHRHRRSRAGCGGRRDLGRRRAAGRYPRDAGDRPGRRPEPDADSGHGRGRVLGRGQRHRRSPRPIVVVDHRLRVAVRRRLLDRDDARP